MFSFKSLQYTPVLSLALILLPIKYSSYAASSVEVKDSRIASAFLKPSSILVAKKSKKPKKLTKAQKRERARINKFIGRVRAGVTANPTFAGKLQVIQDKETQISNTIGRLNKRLKSKRVKKKPSLKRKTLGQIRFNKSLLTAIKQLRSEVQQLHAAEEARQRAEAERQRLERERLAREAEARRREAERRFINMPAPIFLMLINHEYFDHGIKEQDIADYQEYLRTHPNISFPSTGSTFKDKLIDIIEYKNVLNITIDSTDRNTGLANRRILAGMHLERCKSLKQRRDELDSKVIATAGTDPYHYMNSESTYSFLLNRLQNKFVNDVAPKVSFEMLRYDPLIIEDPIDRQPDVTHSNYSNLFNQVVGLVRSRYAGTEPGPIAGYTEDQVIARIQKMFYYGRHDLSDNSLRPSPAAGGHLDERPVDRENFRKRVVRMFSKFLNNMDASEQTLLLTTIAQMCYECLNASREVLSGFETSHNLFGGMDLPQRIAEALRLKRLSIIENIAKELSRHPLNRGPDHSHEEVQDVGALKVALNYVLSLHNIGGLIYPETTVFNRGTIAIEDPFTGLRNNTPSSWDGTANLRRAVKRFYQEYTQDAMMHAIYDSIHAGTRPEHERSKTLFTSELEALYNMLNEDWIVGMDQGLGDFDFMTRTTTKASFNDSKPILKRILQYLGYLRS